MAVVTELILARHGEARCNVAGLVGGEATCTGLTPRGRDQVTRLATRLRTDIDSGHAIDALYAAPRRRTRDTGQILADELGLSLHVEAELDGPHHGDADGHPWQDIKTAFGGPPPAFPDHPYAHGSETWNGYLARACAFLAELIECHAGQRILIAAHGETIQAANRLLLDLSDHTPTPVWFATDHACLTVWQQHRNRYNRAVWILAVHNDTGHLTGGKQP